MTTPIYLPFKGQPLNVFFNLEMGSLSKIYKDPECPVDLMVDLNTSSDQVGQFTITLFDQTGWEVEPHYWESQKSPGDWANATIQWGYLGNDSNISDLYKIECCGYTLDVQKASFGLSLHGRMSMAAITSSTPNGGTLEEIIKKFAKDNNWEYKGANPPFSTVHMMEYGSIERDSTEPTEMKHLKYPSEPDWSFLCRVLQYGRDSENMGGYYPILKPTGSGANSPSSYELVVSKPSNDAPMWTYRVQDPNSTVIQWKPEINFSEYDLGSCGANIQHVGTQKSTGDYSKTVYQPNLVAPYIPDHGYPLFTRYIPKLKKTSEDAPSILNVGSKNIPESTKGGAHRYRTGGSVSPYAGQNPSMTKYIEQMAAIYTAELTVLGDPQIFPGKNCEVIFNYPANYLADNSKLPHYTSGIYFITRVRHIIKMGEYTTILSLKRWGPSDDPPKQGIAAAAESKKKSSPAQATSHDFGGSVPIPKTTTNPTPLGPIKPPPPIVPFPPIP